MLTSHGVVFRSTRVLLAFCCLMFLLLLSLPAQSASFFDPFIDPQDGAFDTSAWILDNRGFLPVPIIISEPAVGPGLGAALVFFHEEGRGRGGAAISAETGVQQDKAFLPPSLSVVFGAGTQNGTWLAGGAHRGVWRNDHIRYLGALAYASINLNFHGTGNDTEDDGSDFNANGGIFLQELMFRIPDTDFFLGGRIEFTSADVRFDNREDESLVPEDDLNETRNVGVGLLAGYDSRDNTFTPNRGINAELGAMFYRGSFAGDFSYEQYLASSQFYWDVDPKLVLGLRLDGRFSTGDAPFYALPYIDLRGIPAMRYQGKDVLVTEIEARWNIHPRWSLVGFTGAGKATGSLGELFESGAGDPKHTIGGGVRYLIARRLGLYTGADIARGPEETAFYIQVGGAWH